jgi:hypothetical protein
MYKKFIIIKSELLIVNWIIQIKKFEIFLCFRGCRFQMTRSVHFKKGNDKCVGNSFVRISTTQQLF